MSWCFKMQLQYQKESGSYKYCPNNKYWICIYILILFIEIIRDTTYDDDDEVNVKGGWEKGGT